MTRWKKALLAASTGVTLLAVATVTAAATTSGRDALRAAGTRAVLVASTTIVDGQPSGGTGGGTTSGTGLGPIQIAIADRWTLEGQLIVKGSVTITCGPFLPGGFPFSNAQVTVEEALGDHVGHAQTSISSLVCDGAHHTYPVTALVSDVPFHPGEGAASVTAQACGIDPTSFQDVCQNGTALTQITIR